MFNRSSSVGGSSSLPTSASADVPQSDTPIATNVNTTYAAVRRFAERASPPGVDDTLRRQAPGAEVCSRPDRNRLNWRTGRGCRPPRCVIHTALRPHATAPDVPEDADALCASAMSYQTSRQVAQTTLRFASCQRIAIVSHAAPFIPKESPPAQFQLSFYRAATDITGQQDRTTSCTLMTARHGATSSQPDGAKSQSYRQRHQYWLQHRFARVGDDPHAPVRRSWRTEQSYRHYGPNARQRGKTSATQITDRDIATMAPFTAYDSGP